MTRREDTSQVSVDTSGMDIDVNEQFELEIVFWVALNGPISVVGSAVNVINIIIFVKQGFKDSFNISLCGLAISDLGALLALVWESICFNPLFRYSNIEFDSIEVQYITGAWPHGLFVRITSWITAFITFERCVCIALPLKVKNIITPKRIVLVVSVIFVTTLASVIPIFCSVNFVPLFNTARNKTMYGMSRTWNGITLESISFSISVAELLTSFMVVIVCTMILIHNLRVKSEWRHNATVVYTSVKSDSASVRDKRVMKMVTLISCIFIICFLPNVINIILMTQSPTDYNSRGPYKQYQVFWAIINTLEAINSSVNILVYYNMSSKYRTSFKRLFHNALWS